MILKKSFFIANSVETSPMIMCFDSERNILKINISQHTIINDHKEAIRVNEDKVKKIDLIEKYSI